MRVTWPKEELEALKDVNCSLTWLYPGKNYVCRFYQPYGDLIFYNPETGFVVAYSYECGDPYIDDGEWLLRRKYFAKYFNKEKI